MTTPEPIVLLIDETPLTLEEVAVSCAVSGDWIIQHVQAGVLLANPGADPGAWAFSSRDLQRVRRLQTVERDFDANPELAGLVADLLEELERLRGRMRRAGLAPE
ncbi:MAG: MerR family transcriptional regulator [Rhodocyclaceae bacterium]|nr:MerR family transcriptional regulator [Rhodocyclaceae bacterium]